jgi:hypothetical protein
MWAKVAPLAREQEPSTVDVLAVERRKRLDALHLLHLLLLLHRHLTLLEKQCCGGALRVATSHYRTLKRRRA